PAARVAFQGRGGRLLLRFRERRAVAAVPYRAHPSLVSCQRLEALRGGEPEVRRSSAGGDAGREPSGGSGAGLPLWGAASNDQGAQAGRASGHLLAYPLAQSGGLWDLPVAA